MGVELVDFSDGDDAHESLLRANRRPGRWYRHRAAVTIFVSLWAMAIPKPNCV